MPFFANTQAIKIQTAMLSMVLLRLGTSNVMSDTLEESQMTVMSRNQCRKSYSDVIDTQICAESATASACTVCLSLPLSLSLSQLTIYLQIAAMGDIL